MRQRIPGFLVVLAFVMLLAPARLAMAVDTCTNCEATCDYYCATTNQGVCFQAVADCGTSTCNFQCSVGGWHWGNCGCPTGSPIFKKQPTKPPLASVGVNLDPAKQVCAPPVAAAPGAKPTETVKPEPKAAANHSSKPEPKPEPKSAATPKPAPRS